MKRYFSISEFILRKDLPVPLEVADKILRYHLWPLNEVRQRIGVALHISKASGYRPVAHELEKGRDGSSEHTFKGKGAADLAVIRPRMHDLAVALIQMTEYTRIAYYPNSHFLHVDLKFPERGRRVFIADGEWKHVSTAEFLNTIKNN